MHEFLTSIPPGVVANIITAVLAAALVYCRRGLARTVKIGYHASIRIVSRRPTVLLWNDADFMYSERLQAELARLLPGFAFHCIHYPRQLELFPLHRYFVAAVVMLDTDVTKLAAEERVRKRIEKRICRYVHKGGGLVGSHDLIYRRTRNLQLQKLFGCTITDFQRKDGPITYHRSNGTDDPLAAGLPEEFDLGDGEVVWGAWKSDCLGHFQTGGRPPRPLVVSRRYYRGRAVWLNSGEMSATLCKSIAIPEPKFVQLLRNSIAWATRSENRPLGNNRANSTVTS